MIRNKKIHLNKHYFHNLSVARKQINKKQIHLGYYKTENEAYNAILQYNEREKATI